MAEMLGILINRNQFQGVQLDSKLVSGVHSAMLSRFLVREVVVQDHSDCTMCVGGDWGGGKRDRGKLKVHCIKRSASFFVVSHIRISVRFDCTTP